MLVRLDDGKLVLVKLVVAYFCFGPGQENAYLKEDKSLTRTGHTKIVIDGSIVQNIPVYCHTGRAIIVRGREFPLARFILIVDEPITKRMEKEPSQVQATAKRYQALLAG